LTFGLFPLLAVLNNTAGVGIDLSGTACALQGPGSSSSAKKEEYCSGHSCTNFYVDELSFLLGI
jgi:hypothetical protein